MRGTDDLLPEQKPVFGTRKRKRKRKGRAQPHRRGSPMRQPGPALTAMLKGGPLFLPNPMDAKRKAQKRQRRHR
jgi:hypothetical protein